MADLLGGAGRQRVRALFRGSHLELVIDAVLAGNSPGLIWADDARNPRSALLWDGGRCFYLAGAADNGPLNAEWGERMSGQVLPQAAARGLDVFKVHYSGPEWEPAAATVFRFLALTRRTRSFYALPPGLEARLEPMSAGAMERAGMGPLPCFGGASPGDPAVPAPPQGAAETRSATAGEREGGGLVLRPIDRDLVANSGLAHRDELLAEIESMWTSVQRFLDHGFGLCLLQGNEIACRCTAEYVSGRRCGVGIATWAGYENRGLATLTTRAFLARCRRGGIAPHWDCWTANLPSVAVAEKVGFVRLLEYPVWLGTVPKQQGRP